ncbi:MAG: phosphoribosylglycinamide formyltransferase [Nitrospirae bacterium]|nr:MAG: phosphoribosylglycinamide formyltransferase [Nitrospirota bacterium]
MTRHNLAVLASGRGSNFQAIIDAVANGYLPHVTIRVLVTDNPGAYALDRARQHGIEPMVLTPRQFSSRSEYYNAIADEFRKRDVSLVVLAGFMRIVGKELIQAFPNRIMNIHPALLPSFPGLHGQKQALDYGVRVSGCTVHFVDEGMDTGPVIIQAAVPVLDDDTEETLSSRILTYEHQIYPEAIRLFAEGRLEVSGRRVIIKGAAAGEAGLIAPPLPADPFPRQ